MSDNINEFFIRDTHEFNFHKKYIFFFYLKVFMLINIIWYIMFPSVMLEENTNKATLKSSLDIEH